MSREGIGEAAVQYVHAYPLHCVACGWSLTDAFARLACSIPHPPHC
jgi:hypothetical protein